ncbi:MAG TPA: hypothetical protein VGK64_23880 [Bryobacteraceae bacterium]
MMRTITMLGLAVLLALQCPAQKSGSTPDKQSSAAQTADALPKKFYRLNFMVQEVENEHVINSRSYSMILRGGAERGSIRSGQKVPYPSRSGANSEWQQISVGADIDCGKLEELGDQVSLRISAEISSVMENHGDAGPSPSVPPIIRNNRWESTVLIPVKKPSILFSSDDPASKRKMQLVLTVTPIA